MSRGWRFRGLLIVAALALPSAGSTEARDTATSPEALTWSAETPIPGGLIRYAYAQDPAQPTAFYVFGGMDGTHSDVAGSWRYEATTDTWTPLAPMPRAIEGPMAAASGGKIYVAGGITLQAGVTDFNVYDIATDTWTPAATLPRGVWGAAMGAWYGKIFLVGGDDDNYMGNSSNEVNIYDIATDTWTGTGTSMPVATVASGFGQLGRYLYVVGGYGQSPANVDATLRYDMEADTWSTGPTFASARADPALVVTQTMLYAVGGDAKNGTPFDPTTAVEALALAEWSTGAWVTETPLPRAVAAHRGGFCAVTATGAVGLSLGGYDGSTIFGDLYSSPVDSCARGLAPSGLAVVSATDVLEPAASNVEVQTEWTNPGSSLFPVVAGTATTVGDFTLEDAAASYGDIGPHAVAPCSDSLDCYAVSTDGVRPSTHWDVVLRESLNAGDVQDWVLHIGSSFDDVPTSYGFYRFIETIFHNGVTGGCTTDTYCPTTPTSRAQMSVFVLRAHEGPSYVPPGCVAGSEVFDDVPATSPYCAYIEELANRGVVGGCGGGDFCPNSPVTRAQMPIFALLTLEGSGYDPPDCVPGSELFGDVPATSPYCEWIEEFAHRGITGGCGGGNYCPNNGTTRGQMAVFQTATFGLLLYEP